MIPPQTQSVASHGFLPCAHSESKSTGYSCRFRQGCSGTSFSSNVFHLAAVRVHEILWPAGLIRLTVIGSLGPSSLQLHEESGYIFVEPGSEDLKPSPLWTAFNSTMMSNIILTPPCFMASFAGESPFPHPESNKHRSGYGEGSSLQGARIETSGGSLRPSRQSAARLRESTTLEAYRETNQGCG